jgi:hypothetical protein
VDEIGRIIALQVRLDEPRMLRERIALVAVDEGDILDGFDRTQ